MSKNLTFLIILGTGLYGIYSRETHVRQKIDTRYGSAEVSKLSQPTSDGTVYVMLRHGAEHGLPPHLINYRANIQAAKELEVDFILATASVGSLVPKIRPGSYVVIDQFIDATKTRTFTFFGDVNEKFAHTDMSEPYSRRIRNAMVKSLRKNKIRNYRSKGTYVCTEGPRFETPAEIRMYRRAGAQVVGMTSVPEVVLANEISIPYGSLGRVTNMATGLQPKVSHSEVVNEMNRALSETKSVLDSAIEELAAG